MRTAPQSPTEIPTSVWLDDDQFALDLWRHWHQDIDFNTVIDGLDYSHICRAFTQDKIGRAIRFQRGYTDTVSERQAYREECSGNRLLPHPKRSKGKLKAKPLCDKLLKVIGRQPIKVFLPAPHKCVGKIIDALSHTPEIRILTKYRFNQITRRNVIRRIKYNNPSLDFSHAFANAFAEVLAQNGLILDSTEISMLQKQVFQAQRITKLAELELRRYQPDSLVMHADNHPPFINYTLVARKLGIPSIMLQHGLDCERGYLDEAYADHIIVWGPERKRAYERDSDYQPKQILIGGNCQYTPSNTSRPIARTEPQIALVTRPHASHKCYAPSRQHDSGTKLLEHVVEFMLKNPSCFLRIKLHPYDLKSLYNKVLEALPTHRYQLFEGSIAELYAQSTHVISEDSTAGVEAFLFGHPVLHAYLDLAKPVMPLADSGAALPGHSEAQLRSNLQRLLHLSEGETQNMRDAQQDYLAQYYQLGETQRTVDLIKQIASQKGN